MWASGGIWSTNTGTYRGDHATCIVGYDDTRQMFRVQNQWGAFGGDNGFYWVTYDLVRNNCMNELYILYGAVVTNRMAIIGDDSFCTTSNGYSISNLQLGATVTWTVTPSNVASIVTSGNTATLTKIAKGLTTLTARITTACGDVITIEKESILVVDMPTIQGYYNGPNSSNQPMAPWNRVSFASNDICYLQFITTNMQVSTGSIVTWESNYPFSQIGNNIKFYFTEPNQVASFFINATNACGTLRIKYTFESASGCVGNLAIKAAAEKIKVAADVLASKVGIYPNPAKTMVYITLSPDSINLPNTTITITDISGRRIKQLTTVSQTNAIQISTWASGTYIVTVTDGKKKIIKKIIKN